MNVININNIGELNGPVVATIGFFDGVHKGHQFLISTVRRIACEKGLKSAVVTFPVHPRFVMNSEYQPVMLSTYEEKVKLLETTGIDYMFVVDFTPQVASLTAREFMDSILKSKLNVSALVIGYDHRFGRNRESGFNDYCNYGKELGIDVIKADEFVAGRYEISSSSVRRYLLSGEVRKATFSLGREYSITGQVVGGYQVGRKLGFPTANVRPSTEKLIPANGVYAVRVNVRGREYNGMLNIGNRPTVGNEGGRSVEVNIFDFNENIYDETITFTFTEYIRSEQKFSSLDDLKEQLRKDERYIRTLYFIKENEGGNSREVALKAHGNRNIDAAYAASQIEGKNIASRKVPSWADIDGIIYPRHLSLEQCSSEETARFKSSLVSGESMVDLTGGMGVDCYFLSGNFRSSVYVERQKELCEIMAHNRKLLNADALEVVNADSVDYLEGMPHVDFIYIDPARRDTHGGKTVLISHCEPDISRINGLLLSKANKVMVKLSPMFDIDQARKEIYGIEKIYVVSVRNECKELLLLLSGHSSSECNVVCVDLLKDKMSVFEFNQEEERNSGYLFAGSLLKYMYEPNSSILKAGGFRILGSRFGIRKLSQNSHLYTSDELVEDFPGRVFEVVGHYDFSKKSIKELTKACPKANITVRNFPASVNELRKRLKIAEGGDDYLFATMLSDKSRVIVHCRKV